MKLGEVVYVGGFILPDKNAAAQRVIGIAKILREIGYKVSFLSETKSNDTKLKQEYFGFESYSYKSSGGIKKLFDIQYIIDYVLNNQQVVAIIAYNFPALALLNLTKFCRKKGIFCFGDITEWYGTKGKSFLYKIIKGIDTCIRMRVANKKLDGCIVISKYLEKYYKRFLPIIKLPPLVDKAESKWNVGCDEAHDDIRFVYAGSPSAEKERLDVIVEAIKYLLKEHEVKLYIIGITEKEYEKIYKSKCDSKKVIFLGKVVHLEAVRYVSKCDYSIFVRDRNRVTQAGFPTKFVESISCGVPVITNDNSCVKDYLINGKNGILINDKNILQELVKIIIEKRRIEVQSDLFDYRNYINDMANFLGRIE